MAAALYDAEAGYYGAGKARIGRKGDFFTSVSVGPLFGRLLARQFAEMWERLGKPERFRVIEQGAHDGALAADVLGGLRELAPACAEAVEYALVEPAPVWRERQQARLAGWARVRWVEEMRALEPAPGVVFSNELLDAAPVFRVGRRGGEWREQCVAWSEGRFVFGEREVKAEPLRSALGKLPEGLPEGYTTEVNLEAGPWVRESAAALSRGWIVAIDYGWARAEYYRPERVEGTLSAYREHQRVEDPLSAPGEIDLTAHVDFTTLMEAGAAEGLTLAGFCDQQHFIAGLGRLHFEDTAHVSPERAREQRAFITLLHPQLLGASFKVLGLAKGMGAVPLAGFSFA